MAIDVSFLRGLDSSAITPRASPRERRAYSTRSLSHRERKIKTSWLSPSAYDEVSLGKHLASRTAFGEQASARGRNIYPDITYLAQYSSG